MRRDLIQDAVPGLQKLADASFPIKSEKECLFSKVYWVCQIDVCYDCTIRIMHSLANRDVHLARLSVENMLLNIVFFL